MKTHLTILMFFMAAQSYGQTFKAATSTSVNAPVVYRASDVDKLLAVINTRITNLEAANKTLTDTLNWYKNAYNSLPQYGSTFVTVNGKVDVNQTPIISAANKTADSTAKAIMATIKVPTKATSVSTSTTTTTTNTTLQ